MHTIFGLKGNKAPIYAVQIVCDWKYSNWHSPHHNKITAIKSVCPQRACLQLHRVQQRHNFRRRRHHTDQRLLQSFRERKWIKKYEVCKVTFFANSHLDKNNTNLSIYYLSENVSNAYMFKVFTQMIFGKKVRSIKNTYNTPNKTTKKLVASFQMRLK